MLSHSGNHAVKHREGSRVIEFKAGDCCCQCADLAEVSRQRNTVRGVEHKRIAQELLNDGALRDPADIRVDNIAVPKKVETSNL